MLFLKFDNFQIVAMKKVKHYRNNIAEKLLYL